MRPCQHCGTAILLNEAVCSKCGGEQLTTVGVETKQVAARPDADNRTAAQRQEDVQREADHLLHRSLVILVLSINVGLILFGYLFDGVEGAESVMFGVAATIVVAVVLLCLSSNPLGVVVLFVTSGGRLVTLLVILNGAGAFLLGKLH